MVDDADDAARGSDDLRGELALLRRAAERLAAEHADHSYTPDYSKTLGVIANTITAAAQRVDALVKSPALSLTPEAMNRQIAAASSAGRSEDRRAIGAARQTIEEIRTPPERIATEPDQVVCKRDKAKQQTFVHLAADGKDPKGATRNPFGAPELRSLVHLDCRCAG